MSIKVLGGFAKGMSLKTPSSRKTRPTSVMLKRKIFDSFQDLEGFVFVDLCSGTGSIALEALSRGADFVYAVESAKLAFEVLKDNSKSFKSKYATQNIHYIKQRFEKFLRGFQFEDGKKYFIFFDPPYDDLKLYDVFFEMIRKLSFKGVVVVEACNQKTMKFDQFVEKYGEPHKNYKQGTSFFALYRVS